MTQQSERPVRVGVFKTVDQADRAVGGLLLAGFTHEQITVICSDAAKERHFKEFEHQEPAGNYTPAAATAGGAIGAVLGGLTAIAGIVTTGGVGLLVAGAMLPWTGAVVGGLVGAMMTRGFEKEVADFYDQAVTAGKILGSVEEHDETRKAELQRAERIFAEAGAEPLELREG